MVGVTKFLADETHLAAASHAGQDCAAGAKGGIGIAVSPDRVGTVRPRGSLALAVQPAFLDRQPVRLLTNLLNQGIVVSRIGSHTQ